MTITTPRPVRVASRGAARPDAAPRPEQRPAADRLTVVSPGSGRAVSRRRRLVFTGTAFLLVVGLFAVVVVHVVLAQQQFQLAKVSAQVTTEQGANDALSLQVAQLQAPSRIVSAAEQQMGMVSPPSVGYLVPGHPGTHVRVPAAPTPTSTTAPPGNP